MNKGELVSLLCDFNTENTAGGNILNEFTEDKFIEICKKLNCSYEDITRSLKSISELYFSETTHLEWKYIILNFYVLKLLENELNKSDDEVLSVQQNKNVKKCLKTMMSVGIYSNLQPNLPFYVKKETSPDIFFNYNILKCTTYGLSDFLNNLDLRMLILPDCLRGILVAAYQIAFCPLKKPSESNSIITEETYQKLINEKEMFTNLLQHLRGTIHAVIFVRETMVIFQKSSPIWFKKAVSHTLTSIILSKNGVENIAIAMFDDTNDDSTKTWRTLEVITKLILTCKSLPDFKENICKQVIRLLEKTAHENAVIYERIFVHCTKTLYSKDKEMSMNIFVRKVMQDLLHFTYKNYKFKEDNITDKVIQIARLINSIFVENSVESRNLPIEVLKPVLSVIFRLYCLTSNSLRKSTHNELGNIIVCYMSSKPDEHFMLYDSFLFEINSAEILKFRNDIILEIEGDNIVLNYVEYAVTHSIAENSEKLMELLKNKTELLVKLFGFLLNCLTNKDKYFRNFNDELLSLESEIMNEFLERNLIVYKLLSDLAEDKTIQTSISENPDYIIKYVQNVLTKTIDTNMHKTTEYESEGFQSVFTIIMILHSLVSNSTKSNLEKYTSLFESLREILKQTKHKELKILIAKILETVEERHASATRITIEEVDTELDKAIKYICDPLLPVRGHGLMILIKLIEKKDKHVLERKQYVLNILQQNLKNDDSFIYLNAIGGLAAMADVFPDIVIKILCEEYLDFSKKDNESDHEVRMKLGEVLVRVSKLLGDMAPKHKSLLLNTFLVGAKDEDYLIRASSLSNLGEICRVLGYKLGSIVTEVLVCIHAIIATDKSVEARRAAVTVIRQLFLGLDSEMMAFLKEDILPVYRTLKQIYNDDKDDVMRLQAQLALEELNENMKNFVFPKPQLNTEKKIIMLN